MRGVLLTVSAVAIVVSQATGARASDPCTPSAGRSYGSFGLVAMIGQMAQQRQLAQDCAAERQAQWADYHARQKALQDKAAADAAQQKQAADAKLAADAAVAAQHTQTAELAAAAEARTKHRRAQGRAAAARAQVAARADAARVQQQTEAQRRDMYVRLVRDENAPGNICHDPKMARTVMEGWNGLDTMKDASVRVIDIEHITTVTARSGEQGVSCHGVFVTNHGTRLIGTATVRRNIAGDPMFVWERDANQDLARYAAPDGVEVHVGAPVVLNVLAKGPPI